MPDNIPLVCTLANLSFRKSNHSSFFARLVKSTSSFAIVEKFIFGGQDTLEQPVLFIRLSLEWRGLIAS